ncbi:MAG: hypothetical protein ACW981_05590 [Candidatus Hodarchaeales archaeon]
MVALKKYIPFVIGFIFFYNGLLFSYLFIDGHSPFFQNRPLNVTDQSISPNNTHDFGVQIGGLPSDFPNRIKILFTMEGSSEVEVFIYYDSDDQNVLLDSLKKTEIARFEVAVDVSGDLTSVPYFIQVSVRNLGPNIITVTSIQASEISLILGFYVWILSTIFGLGIMLLSIYLIRRRKRFKISKSIPEPVLFHQYQKDAKATQKLPPLSRKKEFRPKKTPGQANNCPSCNGFVPKNSTKCPHCFAFLK